MTKRIKCADCHFLCSNYREKWSQTGSVSSVQKDDRPHLLNGKFPPSFSAEEATDEEEIPELKMSLKCWRGNWQIDGDHEGCIQLCNHAHNCDLYLPFEGDGCSFPAVVTDWECEHKKEVRFDHIQWAALFFTLGVITTSIIALLV